MSEDKDNVMDLLDSLESKVPKSKPKKASTKRKEGKKHTGDDILGLLDELNVKEGDTSVDSKDVAAATQSQSIDKSQEPAPASEPAVPDSADLDDPANPGATSDPNVIDPMATISNWWSQKGGFWTKAQDKLNDAVSDAVKQAKHAEQLVREEQQNFNFFGLQSKLTSVLNSIVPPISRHEQLRIHVFHDMVGYPVVDKTIYEVFDYVMEQVEGGGELNMVIQKGKERHMAGIASQKKLNYVECSLEDGAKLAKANIEDVKRQLKEAADKKAQTTPESSQSQADSQPQAENENQNIQVSELFVSVQPVLLRGDESSLISTQQNSLFFVIYLLDFEHNIEISTASQPFPVEWSTWLDNDNLFEEAAIDPRDWISGWIEDGVSLAVGVVAQKYVTIRMNLIDRIAQSE